MSQASRQDAQQPYTLVMDVEGTDGRERGEDQVLPHLVVKIV